MPKATDTPNTSRRALLGAAAALPLAAMPALAIPALAMPTGQDSDAELFAACRDFAASVRETRAWSAGEL